MPLFKRLMQKVRIFYVRAMENEVALEGSPIQDILPYRQVNLVSEKVAVFQDEIVPLFDMRLAAQTPEHDSCAAKVLILSMNKKRIGIIVEKLIDVFDLEALDIEPLPSQFRDDQYAIGKVRVRDKRLLLVDIIELIRPSLGDAFFSTKIFPP